MKILLLSFSGRNGEGNCSKIMDFVQNMFEQNYQYQVEKIAIKDLVVKPCMNCNYECFNSELNCPIEDDVKEIYTKITESDITIMIVPVYSAAPPSVYFSWRERAQGIFTSDKIYSKYSKVKKAFIVIGNENAGANDTINILLKEETKENPNTLLLQSRKYGQRSTAGRLIECSKVREEIEGFIKEIVGD